MRRRIIYSDRTSTWYTARAGRGRGRRRGKALEMRGRVDKRGREDKEKQG